MKLQDVMASARRDAVYKFQITSLEDSLKKIEIVKKTLGIPLDAFSTGSYTYENRCKELPAEMWFRPINGDYGYCRLNEFQESRNCSTIDLGNPKQARLLSIAKYLR